MHKINALHVAILMTTAAAWMPAADVILYGVTIPPGTTKTVTWTAQGYARSARVHVPSGYTGAAPVPLVVVVHGGGGTAASIEASSRWSVAADTAGWLAAYPQGLSLNSAGVDDPANELAYWANDRGTPPDLFGVNDVGMITGLVDSLATAAALDTNRVYAMGMSNGGMMVHRLGRDSARYWAALSAVSGSYTATPSITPFAPAFPVSMFIIHGTSDTIVPYAGGIVDGLGGAVIGAEASRDLWLQADGITTPATQTSIPDTTVDGCTSQRFDHLGGQAGTRVTLIRVDGGNHSWPGGAGSSGVGAGNKTDDFSATDTVQAFFAGLHRQPEIAVAHDGHALSSGDHETITDLLIGTAHEVTYAIANQGSGLLTCSGLAVTAATGCTATVVSQPTTVASATTQSAVLQVIPNAATWSVTLGLVNDDSDEGNYTWTASGNAATSSSGGTSGSDGSGGSDGSDGGGGCGAGTLSGAMLACITLLSVIRATALMGSQERRFARQALGATPKR